MFRLFKYKLIIHVRSAINRCIRPQKSGVLFSDVILADIFTSYAKVFGDLWLSLWMLLPGGSLLVLPTQDGWPRWILPTLMRLVYSLQFPSGSNHLPISTVSHTSSVLDNVSRSIRRQ